MRLSLLKWCLLVLKITELTPTTETPLAIEGCMKKLPETDLEGLKSDETPLADSENDCITYCLQRPKCLAAVFHRYLDVKICRIYSQIGTRSTVNSLKSTPKLTKKPTTEREEFQYFEKRKKCGGNKAGPDVSSKDQLHKDSAYSTSSADANTLAPGSSTIEWSSWSAWTNCSKPCNIGLQSRTRSCTSCRDSLSQEQSKNCNSQSCANDQKADYNPVPQPATNGNAQAGGATWNSWNPWGSCSITCGTGGIRKRIRECPGTGCTGSPSEEVPCEGGPCQAASTAAATAAPNCNWSEWAAWGACSVTCGKGTYSRTRTCPSSSYGGQPSSPNSNNICCTGDTSVTATCQTDVSCCSWSSWTPFGSCSVTCGKGVQTRTRSCSGGYGGQSCCQGESQDSQSCSGAQAQCCSWSDWAAWGLCSSTCGSGTYSRSRTCQGDTYGGTSCCGGESSQSSACPDLPKCCAWGDWTTWSTCSATCGSGTISRLRSCQGGEANKNGCCVGEASASQPCPSVLPSCCNWSEWGAFGSCSVTCGSGTYSKTRTCQGGIAGVGGCCPGDSSLSQPCPNLPVCCSWTEWGPFGTCTATCGSGTYTRSRTCTGGYGGNSCCGGEGSQTQPCPTLPTCCNWSEWGPFGSCSATCGSGTYSKTRTCQGGIANVGGCCPGDSSLSQPCPALPVCCSWSEWGPLGICSATCGSGTQTKTRSCQGGIANVGGCCTGELTSSQPCANLPVCCNWSEWAAWGTCTATCGSGTYSRSRTCQGGTNANSVYSPSANSCCPGDPSQSQSCPSLPQCCNWGDWGAWGTCSATCGSGSYSRTRSCQTTGGGVCTTGNCAGEGSFSGSCPNLPQCITCTPWGEWGKCSSTCDQGTQTRSRSCTGGSGASSNGPYGPKDTKSTEPLTDSQICNLGMCPMWGVWAEWKICSATCGSGSRSRSRVCTGGTDCPGANSDTSSCDGGPCPTWNSWAAWSGCSVTCADGYANRQRSCSVPPNTNCPGQDSERQFCTAGACPTWSDWSNWSECDKPCGGGSQTRTHSCTVAGKCLTGVPGPETQRCNLQTCVSWGIWSPYSDCSASCGGGTQIRSRGCPTNGQCIGSSTDSQSCNPTPCPQWTTWSDWAACSLSCGNGQQNRLRTCSLPAGCPGSEAESRACGQVCGGYRGNNQPTAVLKSADEENSKKTKKLAET